MDSTTQHTSPDDARGIPAIGTAPPAPPRKPAGVHFPDPAPPAKIEQTWQQVESLLDHLGDHFNPIVVKEARQAMKSRQFVITFSLLLIFGWLWTVIFIAISVPDIFYGSLGPEVLTGYYIVLSIPLLIVVPYASFRSLAAEREDGTYDLLSITTLSARQIVFGKLSSAILQMLVYYSALAPCIAFTYLLGGIDVLAIGLYLTYTFLASLLLSIVGLMMATVTRSRHWQVLLSVVFVMALLVFGFIWDLTVVMTIGGRAPIPFDNVDFWIGNLCGLTFYLPLAGLLLLIAAGQITFASENRSSPIRAMLVVLHLLIVGWFTYYWLRFGQGDLLFVAISVLALYWAVIGSLLTGETAQLSPRAKRQLPQSFLGRMAFTWFNPGSGTGYIFAMLNLLGGLIVFWSGVADAWYRNQELLPTWPEWHFYSICLVGYVLGYLGLVRLVVVSLRRITPVGMLATFLGQVIVATGAVLFPYLLHVVSVWGDFSNTTYTLWQLPNWFWTLYEVENTATLGGWSLAVIVAGCGLAIFAINLVLAAREVEHVRTAAPERVAQDELARHPELSPVRKKNPWDD